MSASLNFALIQDIILLLISSIACFYCYLLNKRLKGLSDLKSGVGASIVSLTRAIKDTSTASQSAKQSTQGAVESLEDLIARSEAASIKMEAELISLQRHVKATVQLNHQIAQKIDNDLPNAVARAETVGANLLNIINGATDYSAGLPVETNDRDSDSHNSDEKFNETSHNTAYALQRDSDIKTDKQVEALRLVETHMGTDTLNSHKPEPENHFQSAPSAKTERDEIDILFDNIDALVNAKGVTKKLGFLESKEYYRS